MYSCSSDKTQDGMSIDDGYNINAKINPTQWIQGTWNDPKERQLSLQNLI